MNTRSAGTSSVARRRSWLASPLVALLLLVPLWDLPAGATEPICTPDSLPPGTNGCLPSPLECATGNFNGYWQDNDVPGRAAFCTGGGGHVVHYGARGGGTPDCGTVIDAGQLVVGHWGDPNLCPGDSADPGYGVQGRAFLPAIESAGGVVASISPAAAQAGVDVLDSGGNAVDAAAAAVLAVGVSRPEMCGIGGGGLLVYRGASGEVATLDFRETAPQAFTPTTLEEQDETLEGDEIHGSIGSGHTVVGVPGTMAGIAEAVARFGTKSLDDVIAPAEEMAREGVPVAPGFSTSYGPETSGVPDSERLRMFPEAASIYLRNGLQYPPDNEQADSTLVQKDYARSLALVATFGPDAFYEDGEYPAFSYRGTHYEAGRSIARLIVEDMENPNNPPYPGDKGLMTIGDLESYEAKWRAPLRGTYRGRQIIAMGAPSRGGTVALEMLNIIEGYDVASMQHSSADYFHFLAEAQKIAWADQKAHVTDPDKEEVPHFLTSKGYAAQRRAEIDPEHAQAYEPGSLGDGGAQSSGKKTPAGGHTTHVSVIDGDGNAVAVTCTLNSRFGSAVVAPGTGFLLNNELLDFDDAGTINEPEGGRRPVSNMTPTIVVDGGRAILVGGGGGGDFISNGVILAISNVVDFGMDIAHAVDAARFFEFECCNMVLEDGRVLPEVWENASRDELDGELVRRGHVVERRGEYWMYQFPIIQAVGFDPARGLNVGTSDPREDRGVTAQT